MEDFEKKIEFRKELLQNSQKEHLMVSQKKLLQDYQKKLLQQEETYGKLLEEFLEGFLGETHNVF